MEYSTFVDAMVKKIKEMVDEGTEVEEKTVIRNNAQKRRGVIFKAPGMRATPAVYLEEYYEGYKRGRSISELSRELVGFYRQIKDREDFDGERLSEFSYIEQKLIFQVVNYEMNRELLGEVPYIRYFDLAVCFYVLLDIQDQGLLTFQVRNSYLDVWGKELQEIYRCAAENTPKLLPASFGGINEVIGELQKCLGFGDGPEAGRTEDTAGMYILTNSIKNRGAGAMLYPHVLEMVGELLKSDFYILPSSIHEVIILSAKAGMRRKELEQMVREINGTQLGREEILSDRVYYFDKNLKRILY